MFLIVTNLILAHYYSHHPRYFWFDQIQDGGYEIGAKLILGGVVAYLR